METLIFAQTIFYFSVSAAIIILGILCVIGAYHLVQVVKELQAISRDFHKLSDDAREKIGDIIERLSDLPILSFLLRRTGERSKTRSKKV